MTRLLALAVALAACGSPRPTTQPQTPATTSVAETTPPETTPPETSPPETSPPETSPPETTPPETTPPETSPQPPLPQKPTAKKPGASIGVAKMLDNGTILLQLRAEGPGGMVGDAVLRYEVGHPRYQYILDHLGPMQPGQSRPVLPFPE